MTGMRAARRVLSEATYVLGSDWFVNQEGYYHLFFDNTLKFVV